MTDKVASFISLKRASQQAGHPGTAAAGPQAFRQIKPSPVNGRIASIPHLPRDNGKLIEMHPAAHQGSGFVKSSPDAVLHLGTTAAVFRDVASLPASGLRGAGLLYGDAIIWRPASQLECAVLAARYASILDLAGAGRVVFTVPPPDHGWERVPCHSSSRMPVTSAALVYHIRALLHAAADRHLAIAFPSLDSTGDFGLAREMVMGAFAGRQARGLSTPASFEFGAILNAAELAALPDGFYEAVDFMCITGQPRTAQNGFGESLDETELRTLRSVLIRCEAHNRLASFCGDAARRPMNALALAATGVERLLLPAGAAGPVESFIRNTDLARARAAAQDAIRHTQSVYGALGRLSGRQPSGLRLQDRH